MDKELLPTILGAIERKDQITLMHISKVQQYVNFMIPALTQKNIITDDDIPNLWISAILHDVGKIFISEQLLKKKEKLTQGEKLQLREHTKKGYNFLKSSFYSEKILDAIRHHHERWDGKRTGEYPGYPDGLKGYDIPLYARIIQVADAFDAMTAYRPYKKTKTDLEALEEIKNLSGTQFDPYIAHLFVESYMKFKAALIN